MPNDTSGSGRRVLVAFAGPAFTVVAGLAAGAVGVWAQSQVIRSDIADHDRRIQSLEQSDRQSGSDLSQMKSDVAVLKERVDTIRNDTGEIKAKLDAIIEEQL